jgi:hypothetical protein
MVVAIQDFALKLRTVEIGAGKTIEVNELMGAS